MTTETTTTTPAAGTETPAAATPSAETPDLLGGDTPTEGTPAAEAKPGTEAKPGEAKPGEAKPAEAEVKYEFKAPEGIEFDQPSLEKFTALAKELKLKPEDAQRAVDLVAQMELQKVNEHAETVKAWTNEVKNDKELGGDKLQDNLVIAKKTFSLLPEKDAAQLKEILNQTGLQAHPVFFRLFHAVGKALSEDSFVPGGKRPAPAGDAASRLYPTTANTAA